LASQDNIVRAVILVVAVVAAAAVATVVVVPGIVPFNKTISDCLIEMNLLYIIIHLYIHI
jgi:hypothetical protein